MNRLLTLLGAFLLLSSHSLFAQGPVTGKVTDSKGAPLAGISVKVQGSNLGTSTNADGTFSLNTDSTVKLEFSGVGFEHQVISAAPGQDLSITLGHSEKAMSEVIVTAIGIKREKRQLTYSTQQVSGAELVAAKQDNLVNSLAGKVSGVQITNSTGMPGSSARIVIRGATSLNGENQPLFVVDGVPIDNSEAGPVDPFNSGVANASLNEGSTSNRAIDIDPSIIESVTILKGAAASAIYGASAANGAVIITTKSGAKSTKPVISFSSSYGFNNAILAPFQNKYAQGTGGVFYNPDSLQFTSSNWGPEMDTLKINGAPAPKYDPRKLFFKTGHTTEDNLSVSGASDKSRYLMSYSYLRNDGITPHTNFTRNSFFGKFSNDITKNVVGSLQFNYINSVNNRLEEGNGLQNPLWTVYAAPISWNPFPYLNPDGSQRVYRTGRNNPYYLVDNTGFVSNVNRILPVGSLVYSPLKWLSFTERLGADIYTDQSNYFESAGVINGLFDNNGGVTTRVQNYRSFNNDLFLDAHKDLAPDLTGSFILGTNIYSQYSEITTQTGEGENIPGFYNIASMSTITASDILTKRRKVGVYAQANFEYKKMIDLALTGRYDGSSVLNSSKQYYPYGSAALGFIFTEALKKSSWLNFGKIRFSYSSVGNDNLDPYSLTTPYVSAGGASNNISYPFNGQAGYVLANVKGNPNSVNEKLTESELGLELKFLDNRLYFEGSIFDRETSELLTQVPTAPSSGFFAEQQNSGAMRDKGIELLLSGTPIKNRNFSWDVSATFTKISNKVLKLADGVANIQFGGFGGGGGIYAFPGLPYGVIYGIKYARDAEGNIQTDDNGLPQEALKNGIIGNTQADFNAGLQNTFTYKNFSLSFLIDWKQGGDVYNLDDHYNWFYGTPKVTENRNNPIIVKGTNINTGLPNTVAISAEDYYKQISDIDEAVVENGTYVKLRQASISYTLTPETLKPVFFKSFVITFSGNNLFIYKPYFTGSDPEASLSGSGNGQGVFNYLTPTTRSFIIGIRGTF